MKITVNYTEKEMTNIVSASANMSSSRFDHNNMINNYRSEGSNFKFNHDSYNNVVEIDLSFGVVCKLISLVSNTWNLISGMIKVVGQMVSDIDDDFEDIKVIDSYELQKQKREENRNKDIRGMKEMVREYSQREKGLKREIERLNHENLHLHLQMKISDQEQVDDIIEGLMDNKGLVPMSLEEKIKYYEDILSK